MDIFAKDYGLVSDPEKVQTRIFQNAIDECSASGGGTVYLFPGLFRSGTIYLKNNVFLHLPAGCRLKASDSLGDYNGPTDWPQNNASVNEHTTGGHLIVFLEVENAGLTGDGIVDGNGMHYGYRRDLLEAGKVPADTNRPAQMVYLCESKNIRIRGVQLLNSSYWSCFVWGCSDVILTGLKIKNNPEIPNSDGIDIDASRNVIVSDCLIDTEDDCITFRCVQNRLKNSSAILENVTVTNCQLRTPGCNAFRIGVGNGIIRDCCVSNCVIRGSSKGVCLEARYNGNTDERPGCNIENIQFTNLFMECICPFYVSSYCMGPYPVKAPPVRNIRFSNIVVQAQEQCMILTTPEALMEGISFNGVTLEYSGSPRVALLVGYGEWTHATNVAAFYLCNVKDVSFRDVTVRVMEESSPIQAVTIQDNCQAWMDHVTGTRDGEALPEVMVNPAYEYLPAILKKGLKDLEASKVLYQLDESVMTEMRAFAERLRTMMPQLSLFERYYVYPGRLDKVFIDNAFPAEEDANRFRLLMILCFSAGMEAAYRAKGYPEGVWKEGLPDLNLWLAKLRPDLGYAGLTDRIATWCQSVQSGSTIQLGRLQCNLKHHFTQHYAAYLENGTIRTVPAEINAPRDPAALVQYRDPLINLHVPASGPLKKEECLASLRRMKELSIQMGLKCLGFVCYSWLLDQNLLDCLPEKSNIRDFAGLGYALPSIGDQTQEVIWRLWDAHVTEENFSAVPRDTSLRKNAAEFIEKGGRFREGILFIPFEEI